MLRYSKIYNMPVFAPKKGKAAKRGEGTDERVVFTKIGRIRSAVFTPDGKTLVGMLVKRPDVVGMIKRDDLFLGVDSFKVVGKGIHTTRKDDSFDDVARKRLGVDWDRCILWTGMDAKTADGYELGYVNDSEFDETTGQVTKFFVGDDGVSQQLVGSVEIPADMVQGYSHGFMVVSPEARHLKLNGGLAAQAGEATAKAKIGAQQAGEKVAKSAAKAVDKGSHNLGKMIGDTKRAYQAEAQTARPTKSKQTTNKDESGSAARAVGRQLGKFGSMFGSFAEEYKKSSK